MPGFLGRDGCPAGDEVGVRRDVVVVVVGVVDGLGSRDAAGDARAAVGVV